MEIKKGCFSVFATDLSEAVVSELNEAIEDLRLLKSECDSYTRFELESTCERLESVRELFE